MSDTSILELKTQEIAAEVAPQRAVVLDRKLAALAELAAQDGMRPVLAGIRVKGEKAVATDGFALLELTLPRPVATADLPETGFAPAALPEEGVILPAPAFKAALKAIPKAKRGQSDHLERAVLGRGGEAGTVRLVSTNLETTNAPELTAIDGTYPDTDQVFERTVGGDPVVRVAFDARLMIRVLQAMVAAEAEPVVLGREKTNRVVLELRGPDQAMLLTSADGDGRPMRALVMPMVMAKEGGR